MVQSLLVFCLPCFQLNDVSLIDATIRYHSDRCVMVALCCLPWSTLQSTLLHLAAGYNRTRIVQRLIQHGADVHAKDKGSVLRASVRHDAMLPCTLPVVLLSPFQYADVGGSDYLPPTMFRLDECVWLGGVLSWSFLLTFQEQTRWGDVNSRRMGLG